MTFECVVSADLFRRVQLARSKEEMRYYLNGVLIEPCPEGGALLVATDGRRMLAFRDPDAHVTESAVVSLTNDMTKALNAKAWKLPGWNGLLTGSGEPKRYVAVRGQKAAVIETRASKGAALDSEALLEMVDNPGPLVGAYQWSNSIMQDTKYPAWRGALKAGPDFLGSVSAAIDAERLLPLATALTSGRMMSVRMFPTKGAPEGPVYIFPANNRVDGFGVLMPPRGHGDYAMPSWMTAE